MTPSIARRIIELGKQLARAIDACTVSRLTEQTPARSTRFSRKAAVTGQQARAK